MVGVALTHRTSRRLAREKATLDLIEKSESSEYYAHNSQVFSRLRMGIGFDHLHPIEDESNADRQAVLNHLNHCELVSLGISMKLLDGKTYRKWMGTPLIRDWKAAADLIWRLRWRRNRKDTRWVYHPKAYEHFEAIACRWGRLKPLKAQRRSKPRDEDAGVGDEAPPVMVGEVVTHMQSALA